MNTTTTKTQAMQSSSKMTTPLNTTPKISLSWNQSLNSPSKKKTVLRQNSTAELAKKHSRKPCRRRKEKAMKFLERQSKSPAITTS
jgi:hypothetical protein